MYSAGTYKEIVPMEKIVTTDHFSNEYGDVLKADKFGMDPDFPLENLVIITFEDHGKGTKLTITYQPESDAALKAMKNVQMKEGWESSLEKLVESLK